MRRVILGKSGLEVSAVGFGGIPIQRVPQDKAVEIIRRTLDLGVNFFDTAAGYGDSQAKIGLGIAGRREGLILATKSFERTKEGILRDVERARKEMQTDVIDLFQLHCVSGQEDWQQASAAGGALEGLIEAREAGIVGHIGFTSHSLDTAIELVDEEVFETVQFSFNLVMAEPADELIPKAKARGLGFVVMKPLCGGMYDDANLAFKFLNGFPQLVPIPGIEKLEEIEQIVETVDSGQVLEGAEKRQAERIAAKLGKLFCRRCGYCMPCPEGVPVSIAMTFDSIVKRMPADRLRSGFAKRVAEQASKCVECGECETKCPYNLPIIETIKRSVEIAKRLLAG